MQNESRKREKEYIVEREDREKKGGKEKNYKEEIKRVGERKRKKWQKERNKY